MSPTSRISVLLPLLAGCAAHAPQRPPTSAGWPPGDVVALPAAPLALEAAPAIAGTTRTGSEPLLPAPLRGRDADALMPRRLVGDSDGYTRVKVGAFYGEEDLESLDTGVAAEVVFGQDVLPFLDLEVSAGYIEADGDLDAEVWAVPLFLQARASVPIAILEPYAGVGVGAIYVDASVLGQSSSDFVIAGTGFVGLEVGLGNLAVGAEAKYLRSDTIDSAFEFEGWTGMVFLSLPF